MNRIALLAFGLLLCAPPPALNAEPRETPPEKISRERAMEIAAQTSDQVPVGTTRSHRALGGGGILLWEPLGPRPIAYEYWSTGPAAGRTSAVLVDPRDADVVYIAAAQGGVWKTTDGGSNWTSLTDHLSSLSSGALAFDPRNPDVLYYATGEQHQSGDNFYGDGLFKSTNTGASWTKISTRAQVGDYMARIATHPNDPETLYVASSRGFVRSLDGGQTWIVTLGDDWAFDLEQHPTNPDVIYTTIAGHGVYRSSDAGATWTKLAGGLPAASFDRIEIALAPSDPEVLYAGFAHGGNGSLLGMYLSEDGGETWTKLVSTPNYLGSQGWYDHCLIVDPTNPDVCFAGGQYPYAAGLAGVIRTTDRGVTWTDITIDVVGNSVHPDQHAFAFGPDGTLWLTNDGGVWKSSDGGAHWTHRNHGLEITQFYTVGVHPTDRDRILGGTQDNGTLMYQGDPLWQQVIAGDGGYTFFLWNDPETYYTSQFFLRPIIEWYQGGFVAERQGPWQNDRVAFTQGPLIPDPNTPDGFLAGTYRVWRTNNRGLGWSALSGDVAPGTVLHSIAVAEGAFNTIYAGSFLGHVHYTTNGMVWTRRDNGLPRKPINDIWIDPADHMTAYLSSDTANGGRVWGTHDAGVTWMDVSGDLPANLRGLCLAADFHFSPPRLYLGTDYGVYSSQDGGVQWVNENAGLPGLAIYDLAFARLGGELIAATHGRGMWRGNVTILAVDERASEIAALAVAVPNPARAPVNMDFRLLRDAPVRVEIFDVGGRRVRSIERGPRFAGTHRVTWDGRDDSGATAGNGIYFCRIATPTQSKTARFALLH